MAPAKDHSRLSTAVLTDDARQEAVQTSLKQEVCLGGSIASHNSLQLDRPDLFSKVEQAVTRHIKPAA